MAWTLNMTCCETSCQGPLDDASVRCALVRIVVAFIKRQWPADWPTVLEELKNTIQYGVK